jgi:hypothetical protein
MKLPIKDAPLFAAEIDVADYEEDGIAIKSIAELVLLIQRKLGEKRMNGVLTRDVITGGRAKPIHELLLPQEAGFAATLMEIRAALDSEGIVYYEPYIASAHSREFRFITPRIFIFS